MSADGLGVLWRIVGHLNAEQYIHMLENMMPSVRQSFPDGRILFQHDRFPIHTSRAVREWFERHQDEIALIYWPGKGFDISPIEPVWARRQKHLLERRQFFSNPDQLYQAVEEEWERLALDVNFARNLVNSIPRRMQAIIDKRGGITKY